MERAQTQHEIADEQASIATKQHAVAEKVVVLGLALEQDAIKLNGELEFASQRPSYCALAEAVEPTKTPAK